MRMRRPEAARAALDDALHLGEELTVKHQSIYLVDLATTYTQEHEPEEACRLAGKALDLAGPMHYSTTMERMTALRRNLDAAAGLSASYARALIAQFQVWAPADIAGNGRRPTASAMTEGDSEIGEDR